jgi:hypothetical protein
MLSSPTLESQRVRTAFAFIPGKLQNDVLINVNPFLGEKHGVFTNFPGVNTATVLITSYQYDTCECKVEKRCE